MHKEITTDNGLYTIEVWVDELSKEGSFEICGDHESTEEDHAIGGLWFDECGTTGKLILSDYDGVFALDSSVIDILEGMDIDASYAE